MELSKPCVSQIDWRKLLNSEWYSFIPEGTAIFIPTYALHRDPRYFSPLPDKFWPDRWLKSPCTVPLPPTATEKTTESPNVITNHTAFLPFSYGPANCVGKSLALIEMRMVVALLLQRFDMRFADGWNADEWEEKLEDWHMLVKGRLPVVLTPRPV